ncbi:hypothetical protein [Streptomyces sp. CNQ085]|nr:hypothetical protein [Streptomyces sp. CNQ085]
MSASGGTKAIDEAGHRIHAAVPVARVIYLEPDIHRAEKAEEAARFL